MPTETVYRSNLTSMLCSRFPIPVASSQADQLGVSFHDSEVPHSIVPEICRTIAYSITLDPKESVRCSLLFRYCLFTAAWWSLWRNEPPSSTLQLRRRLAAMLAISLTDTVSPPYPGFAGSFRGVWPERSQRLRLAGLFSIRPTIKSGWVPR